MTTLVTGGNIRPQTNTATTTVTAPRPKLGRALTTLGILAALAAAIGVYLVTHNSVHTTITSTSFTRTTTSWLLLLPFTILLLAAALGILGGIALRTPPLRTQKFLVGGTIIATCIIFMIALMAAMVGDPGYSQWGSAHNLSNLNFPSGNTDHTIINTTVITDQNNTAHITWRIIDGDNYIITINK